MIFSREVWQRSYILLLLFIKNTNIDFHILLIYTTLSSTKEIPA